MTITPDANPCQFVIRLGNIRRRLPMADPFPFSIRIGTTKRRLTKPKQGTE